MEGAHQSKLLLLLRQNTNSWQFNHAPDHKNYAPDPLMEIRTPSLGGEGGDTSRTLITLVSCQYQNRVQAMISTTTERSSTAPENRYSALRAIKTRVRPAGAHTSPLQDIVNSHPKGRSRARKGFLVAAQQYYHLTFLRLHKSSAALWGGYLSTKSAEA